MAKTAFALWHPSQNYGERRGGVLPDMVVLHYTAMASLETALERLCDPNVEVSTHYLVGRDGRCVQMVDERQRAWHAGAGCWGGRADVNSHSIGIELDNDGTCPFSEPLMSSLDTLLANILKRWSIPPERVIGHSDMAPERKIDPGRHFDWQRLARRGLACWPTASVSDEGALAPEEAAPPTGSASEAAFRRATAGIGYTETADLKPLLNAFRARYRQSAHGPLTDHDISLAEQIARRFPVDPAPHSS